MDINKQAEEYSYNTYKQAFAEEWTIQDTLKEAYIAGYNQCILDFKLNKVNSTEGL